MNTPQTATREDLNLLKLVSLSRRWMSDHLDCWNWDIPIPTTIKETKTRWIGALTDEQALEIRDRAEMYADTSFPDYLESCPGLVWAAKAVLKQLKAQGAWTERPEEQGPVRVPPPVNGPWHGPVAWAASRNPMAVRL